MMNKILALKYRPQEFKDLIGQEVMSQTITNAIKLGKTPNAYLLTGIRKVEKTTTATEVIEKLDNFIRPLLENLAKDSDKDYIYWPNRSEILFKKLEELDTIQKNI